jgi:hypothetical protein
MVLFHPIVAIYANFLATYLCTTCQWITTWMRSLIHEMPFIRRVLCYGVENPSCQHQIFFWVHEFHPLKDLIWFWYYRWRACYNLIFFLYEGHMFKTNEVATPMRFFFLRCPFFLLYFFLMIPIKYHKVKWFLGSLHGA